MKVMIRHAQLHEKRKTYHWLYQSDTTAMHSGAPDYPENPISDWETFSDNFKDFYFEENGRRKGSVMVIEEDGQEIGNVCYSLFHLQPQSAELDIWLNSTQYLGKGYGTKALCELIDYLKNEFGVRKFIIRPSNRNNRAIRSYEKAGFRKVENQEETAKQYLKPEYWELYADGDYGTGSTTTLILEL